jgi:hypothetical protein
MMVRDFPEVIETVLESISENEMSMDYRIVGNRNGTSIVLRYTRLYSVCHTPLWQHVSPCNPNHDNVQQNTWIKDSSICQTGVLEKLIV